MRLAINTVAVVLTALACGPGTTQVTAGRLDTSNTPAPYKPGAWAPIGDGLPGCRVPIEDPSGTAMNAFHAALERAATGKGKARLLFYGASHVAGDMFTGYIRRALQARFGDAGHGFLMPARPWRTYRQSDVNIRSTNTWHTDRVTKPDDRKDGWYGLAGMSVSSSSRKDWAEVKTTRDNRFGRRVSRFELWYLKQPGGGRLDVRIDGRRVKRLRTASPRFEPGYAIFKVRDRGHSIRLRPVGDGEVRLFGLVMERDVPGVVLDALGIPGSRARYQLEWNADLYREHLARRDPDLVVLAYGTNESGDDVVPLSRYDANLRAVLDRVRDAVPDASCLLIGPSDRPVKLEDGSFADRPRTQAVVRIQRRAAEDYGCGFFDVVAFMGGPMSMPKWVASDLASPDHVHFTRRGYERLGAVLLDALLDGFDPGLRSR